jgi:hypothetical protein
MALEEQKQEYINKQVTVIGEDVKQFDVEVNKLFKELEGRIRNTTYLQLGSKPCVIILYLEPKSKVLV